MPYTLTLHKDGNAYITKDNLQPSTVGQNSLKIDRNSGSVATSSTAFDAAGVEKQIRFKALVGMIRLLFFNYIIIITGKIKIGTITITNDSGNTRIYKATQFQVVPLGMNRTQQKQNKRWNEEQKYLNLLEHALSSSKFSYYYQLQSQINDAATTKCYNLFASLQSQSTSRDDNFENKNTGYNYNSEAHDRFCWNQHLLRPFEQHKEFCSPIMMGNAEIEDCTINNTKIKFILISRRSTKRAGTRFTKRGIDEFGNAANSVETEQIIIKLQPKSNDDNGNIATSFLQTRGSIPIHWKQTSSLQIKPTIQINRNTRLSQTSLRKHMAKQQERYGEHGMEDDKAKLLCVNLINSTGAEAPLALHYSNSSADFPNLKYFFFDFHKECKGMNYENVAKLIDQLKEDFSEMKFFCLSNEGKVTGLQHSIIRTNCLDNLDRTNVVQSMFARHVVPKMLIALDIIKEGQQNMLPKLSSLQQMFKHMWASNADALSMQYAGSPALKTDFTRTGKRTYAGIVNDAISGITRFYVNNFEDGFNQDAIDLLLGNYVVDVEQPSPFDKQSQASLPKAVGALLFAMLISIFALRLKVLNVAPATLLAFWLFTIFVFVLLARLFGRHFVDKPTLCKS